MAATDNDTPTFATFREFYPFYLREHLNVTCRRLHFIGSSLVLGVVLATVLSGDLRWLIAAPIAGYGFAWVGHFFFEHNRPATFKYPLYSFIGDWAMYWDILSGKIKF